MPKANSRTLKGSDGSDATNIEIRHWQLPLGMRRKLQNKNKEGIIVNNNNNNNKEPDSITTRTERPIPSTVSPTQTPPMHRSFVTLQWSMINTTIEEWSPSYKTEFMEDWLLTNFLCANELWMANSLNLLQNDCMSLDKDADLHALLDSGKIILWNEPYVYYYSEQVEDLYYDVWNAQYPVFIDWKHEKKEDVVGTSQQQEITSSQQRTQKELQDMMDQRIQKGELQCPERGIVSILGLELETWWLFENAADFPKIPKPIIPNLPSPTPEATSQSLTLAPHDTEPLVLIGGIIVLVHTLVLICLHFILKPCLKKQNELQQLERTKQLEANNIRDSSRKSVLSDHMNSFLAPNHWIHGGTHQPKQQNLLVPSVSPQRKQQHQDLLVPSVSLFASQMPDEDASDLSSLNYLSALDSSQKTYFSTNNEDIEVLSMSGSDYAQDTTDFFRNDASLLAPSGGSVCTKDEFQVLEC